VLDLNVLIAIPLLPLVAATIAGLAGQRIGRVGAHSITILAVAVSCGLSMYVLYQLVWGGAQAFDGPVYTWAVSDGVRMEIGFLVDRLSALMMAVVTFVSLCVHIYTIGYMADDPGYQRFFSYISLFTFSMLMLVMSNNFLQLFFGWEAVGVVSYLLIGFWFTRPTATFAALKAFLVNRIGDFGFILGIAGVVYYTGSLHYADAFQAAPAISREWFQISTEYAVPALSLICICLFVGAMGKSAQMPLHVWLPDSMEGPTPISALIHAATMVTAGIFMVARMSPLFEHSDLALSVVLVIGASTALFMGLLGIVSNDIKRVVAYSTLSQLGYMTVALGASAYGVAIFHLMTHAFFKALLFLAAGSVIIALHHEQDMRRMGGLRKYMPITFWTSLIGSLALIAAPFFSGFYSKDIIIESVHESHRWAAEYAYWCVLLGVFVTALYTFRMLFMTFFGENRWKHASHDQHHEVHEPHETPAVVTVPLILLAIPSVVIGAMTVQSIVFGGFFGDAIFVRPENDVVAEIGEHFPGWLRFAALAPTHPPFWLAAAGVGTAWLFFLRKPDLATRTAERFSGVKRVLDAKFGFDWFNENVIAPAARLLGRGLWRGGDQSIIDGVLVNGTAAVVGAVGVVVRRVQSGYLYSYAFWMIIGLAALLGWFLSRALG
jgi:NADH-quinone oxidoreductase subunit L